jgi:hypothetical protein
MIGNVRHFRRWWNRRHWVFLTRLLGLLVALGGLIKVGVELWLLWHGA